MKLSEAFKIATADTTPEAWASGGQAQWKEAEALFISKGLCPHCACDGEGNRLGKYRCATAEEYGGRYCLTCKEFTVCGSQETVFESVPDYGGAECGGMVVSDADPGL